MGYWYNENSQKGNIAVSTRVRLARNLKNIPFPSKMSAKNSEEINSKIKEALNNSNDEFFSKLKFISMNDIPENERYAMVERHIISREFALNYKNKAILISEDETVTVMIGEEDHLRIQVIYSGLNPKKAYETAGKIDDVLCDVLDIAFDDNLGFLTECPTNLGTGLRVSVMMHLPLLEAKGEMPYITQSVSKLGYTVRGMYGEGTKAQMAMYQISNQVTLGITEEDAIKNIELIANDLIKREENIGLSLDKIQLEDRCMRALYTLKSARIISSNEMMSLISDVMLGINFGIIDNNLIIPVKMLIEGQPYSLMSKYGDLSARERDIKRAEMLRNYLS